MNARHISAVTSAFTKTVFFSLSVLLMISVGSQSQASDSTSSHLSGRKAAGAARAQEVTVKLSLVAVDDKGGYGTMIDASGSPRLRFVCMSEPFGQRCYWLDYLTEAGAGLGSVEGIGCSEDNARYCSVIHDWKVRSLLSMVRAASPQCPLDVIVKIDRASGLVRHVGTNLAACAVL